MENRFRDRQCREIEAAGNDFVKYSIRGKHFPRHALKWQVSPLCNTPGGITYEARNWTNAEEWCIRLDGMINGLWAAMCALVDFNYIFIGRHHTRAIHHPWRLISC